MLGRLDPPEAYLPEDFVAEPAMRTVARASRMGLVGTRTLAQEKPRSSLALASGILGIIAVIGLALQFPFIVGVANLLQGNGAAILILWYMLTTVVFVVGVTAIGLAAKVRLRGGWAIAGLATGILSVLGAVVFSAFGLFL